MFEATVGKIWDDTTIKRVSRLDIVRELHGKQITLVFVEEDGNNILGFRYDDTMYVFDSNIKWLKLTI